MATTRQTGAARGARVEGGKLTMPLAPADRGTCASWPKLVARRETNRRRTRPRSVTAQHKGEL